MTKQHFSHRRTAKITAVFASLLLFIACSKDDVIISPDAMDIDTYLKSLNYDLASLLNEKDVTGSSDRTIKNESTTSTPPYQGKYEECSEVTYQLDKNFDKVTILRPTNGIIWPGALVYGDKDMLDGVPRPVTLDRSPVTLRLDLPGMGDEGTIKVDDPRNSTVQNKINAALEWWNANEYQEGYVNPSLSEYQSSVSHTSEQLGLDVGMNVEWASGAVESQLSYTSNTQTQVAVLVFKQVFYSVTMDTPDSPGAVFGPDVRLADVQANIDESQPAAYVSSVDYGRIIMFRMEARDVDESISLNAVLEYASGVSGGTVNTDFDQVLNSSSTSITVLTLGGNAEVASEAVTADGIGALSGIITGKNAVYGRDNPGVPIGYTIRFLKDNALAKMGYTTEYTLSECRVKDWNHADIVIRNKFNITNIRARLKYTDDGDVFYTGWQTIKDETFEGKKLDEQAPDGVYDVELFVEKYEVFGGWDGWVHEKLYHVSSSESCWEAYYNGSGDKAFRKCP